MFEEVAGLVIHVVICTNQWLIACFSFYSGGRSVRAVKTLLVHCMMLEVRTFHLQISNRKHGFSHLIPFVSWAAG